MKHLTLFPLEITSTMMPDLFRCELFFFRKHCQHYFGYNKSEHLKAGVLFAKACEMIRKGYYFNHQSMEECFDEMENYVLSAEDTGSFNKSNEQIVYAIKRYFKKFPLNEELQPVILADGTPCVEYKFFLDTGIPHPDFPNRNIIFSGKIDFLGQMKLISGKTKFFLIDEKTTERVSRLRGTKLIDIKQEELKYATDSQFINYTFALKHIGLNIDEIIVRRVPFGKEHEEAFELSIQKDDWKTDIVWKANISRIYELREKYLHYKANKISVENKLVTFQDFFLPSNCQSACWAFNQECPYMDGCLHKEGEELLRGKYYQGLYNKETEQIIQLSTAIDRINAGQSVFD